MPFALKIVPFGSTEIEAQYNLLLQAAACGAPVAEVVPNTYFSTNEGCGYVMKSAAERRLSHTVRDDVVAAFRALGELHTSRYVHGDARLPNVLYFNGRALWIDLQPTDEDLTVTDTFLRLAREDIKKLIKSAKNDKDYEPSWGVLARYDGTVTTAITIVALQI
jgi:tRNA A-37 threonylcarbamoyl transferase component Bud32